MKSKMGIHGIGFKGTDKAHKKSKHTFFDQTVYIGTKDC